MERKGKDNSILLLKYSHQEEKIQEARLILSQTEASRQRGGRQTIRDVGNLPVPPPSLLPNFTTLAATCSLACNNCGLSCIHARVLVKRLRNAISTSGAQSARWIAG